MYRPTQFREDRPEVLRALIRAHPLGTLVTAALGLDANQIPFHVGVDAEGREVLQAHVARSNDQLAALAAGGEALVIFQGPEAYITPSWYPTKHEHGKAVPTWNYVAVQVWGRPRLIDERDFVLAQIDRLTAQQEQERAAPWAVSDAPPDYIDAMLRHIVGLEIAIDRIEGKWKVSQNQPEGNRLGVIDGLRGEADAGAGPMADLVAGRARPAR
jgi:transcriptional regulator